MEFCNVQFNSTTTDQLLDIEEIFIRRDGSIFLDTIQISVPGSYTEQIGNKIRILNAHVQDSFILQWSPLLPPGDTIVLDRIKTYTIYFTNTSNTKTEELPVKSSLCIDVSPNPFSNHLAIDFKGKESGIFKIVTLSGQVVKSFHSSRNNPKGVLWNGTANNGAMLPNGIYVINYSDGKTSIQKRIVLQR